MAASKKMEMEFGVRVATHSILKDMKNGCKNNLVFSPLSIHTVFNLLTAGAKGRTLDQLLRFLDSESITQLSDQSSLFMDLARPRNKSRRGRAKPRSGCGPIISLVNGIWVDHSFPLKHSFKQLAEDVYKAKSQSAHFNKAEQVAHEINLWAKKASKGHIDNLVSAKTLQDSIIVLASALYFKGSWLNKFDASYTRVEDFRLLNGKRVRAPFMKQFNTRYFYKSFEGFKLLKMDYKNGQDNKNYTMHIFLPDKYDGLGELIQKFHSDPKLFTNNHKLRSVEINILWLPKLKYEYGFDLADNIKELGLDLPFQVNAELTEIVDHRDNVRVSKVIHKSYVEVNEEGMVATSTIAMSTIGCKFLDLSSKPPIDFVADHPFLFVIKEEMSGIVLFVGAALNPFFTI